MALGLPRTDLSACLSFLPPLQQDCISSDFVEAAVRLIQWPERSLVWHDAKAFHGIGCGFISKDMYSDFSDSDQDLPAWMVMLPDADLDINSASLEVCCSLQSFEGEGPFALAELLLERVRDHFVVHNPALIIAARVSVISTAKRLPLRALPLGLASLHVPADTIFKSDGVSSAEELLNSAGMLVVPDALGHEEIAGLRKLVAKCVQSVEAQLAIEGLEIGSGEIHFTEVSSRGAQRWDLSMYAGGEQVVAMTESDNELLVQIATYGSWVPIIRAVLGEEHTWQASVICSRPGAPAGRWHADGGHSCFVFDGESGDAHALCVFVPLVPLDPPTRTPCGSIKHGRGCTVFWPGSHRYRECPHLGAAAAERMHAVVVGAPLNVGSALMYDYRTVHCASPNDAHESLDNERPILQLTYCRKGYEKHLRENYGYTQLFCD